MKGTLYFVCISMILSGCSKFQTPITKRTQMMLLSKESEVKLGEEEFHNLKRKSQVCKDMEKCEAINRVGNKLVSNIRGDFNKWEFLLIENDAINAVCFSGGKVIINSGVFKVAKNDDQLATILSHEIAHAISRHGNARVSRARVLNGFEAAGSIITGLLNPAFIIPFIITYENVTKQKVTNPASRAEELDADIIGLNLMYKAGYNLDEAITFWDNLIHANAHKRHIKNSTHLSYDKRLKRIKKTIDSIKQSDS